MARMRHVSIILLCLIAILAIDRHTHGQILNRTLELRDGSVLQVKIPDQEIPWRKVAIDGTITEQPIDLSKVGRIVFSESPATERVSEVRRLLNLLGSPSFLERERAQAELTDKGGQFKEIIRQYTTEDNEIQWRLKEIISEIEDASGDVIQNQFDVMTLAEVDESQDGDAADWKMEVEYQGKNLIFDRKLVMELHSEKPELNFGDGESSGNRQVARSEQPPQTAGGPIPAGFVRIDFDTAPDGKPISTKQRLNDLFIDQGCLLRPVVLNSPDSTKSFVQAYRYNCGGLSGDKCAGNNSPPYGGIMEISFCIPGKVNFPAGVKYVGFFTSAVKKDGTSLEAYDGFGQLIKSIKTVKGNSDYLGIESGEPIARVRIVPNEEIDPDYAIDDLFFTSPRPLVESGDPEMFTVVLKSADRLQSRAMEIDGSSLTMKELTFTEEPLDIELGNIAVLAPRKPADMIEASPEDLFVQLTNQDILQVDVSSEGFKAIRTGELIARDQIAAFWNRGNGPGILPVDYEIPEGSATLVMGEDTYDIDALTLGDEWFKADDLDKRPDLKYTYTSSPGLHFRAPKSTPKGAGAVRTTGGEVFWVADETGNELKNVSTDAVEIVTSGKTITIPMTEINSIRMSR